MVSFGDNRRRTCNRNTLEVLTLVLVIFAALTYIENPHNYKLCTGYLFFQVPFYIFLNQIQKILTFTPRFNRLSPVSGNWKASLHIFWKTVPKKTCCP